MKSISILVALLVAFSAIAAPRQLRDCTRGNPLTNVALAWKPTDKITLPPVVTIPAGAPVAVGSMMSATVRIEVKTLTDSRQNPKRIGESIEDADTGCLWPVTSNEDAAAWTATGIRSVLGQLGFTMVEKDGDVVLSGELRKFFVTEDSVYRGELGLRLDVAKDGKVIWSGLVTGTNTRFGRSYKLSNYQESFSDAVVDAIGHVVEDANFIRAVSPPSP